MKLLNEIAKVAIDDVEKATKKYVRKAVLSMLGFKEDTWGDVKVIDESSLIQEIKDSDEYKQLRNKVKQEMMENVLQPFTIRGKAQTLKDVRERIQWNLQDAIRDEITAEMTQQALEIIKADPSVSPILIAAQMIERLKK